MIYSEGASFYRCILELLRFSGAGFCCRCAATCVLTVNFSSLQIDPLPPRQAPHLDSPHTAADAIKITARPSQLIKISRDESCSVRVHVFCGACGSDARPICSYLRLFCLFVQPSVGRWRDICRKFPSVKPHSLLEPHRLIGYFQCFKNLLNQ